MLGMADHDGDITLCKPAGCESCKYTGFRGRTGIYEMIEIDEEMRIKIYDGASEQELNQVARERYPGIERDGLRRILAGETSLEEVLRVTAIA